MDNKVNLAEKLELFEEAHLLLIEPKGTPNTGDAGGPLSAVEKEI